MVGQFAVSLAGHDKGTLYVIVKEAGTAVFLSDGRNKTQDAPKKKSRKHIQIINETVSAEMVRRLESCERIYPEQIRAELGSYLKKMR